MAQGCKVPSGSNESIGFFNQMLSHRWEFDGVSRIENIESQVNSGNFEIYLVCWVHEIDFVACRNSRSVCVLCDYTIPTVDEAAHRFISSGRIVLQNEGIGFLNRMPSHR